MEKVNFPFDIETFFKRCVTDKNIPKNDFEKQAILLVLVSHFQDNKIYTEQQVNDELKKYFEDYTLLRRELVNFGYMRRNPTTGEYWVVKRVLSVEDVKNNTLLRRHAKAYKIIKEDA